MSASDKINQLFWLHYAQKIKEKATANFGKSGAFFVASETQKGPLGGDGIPDEYTYQGIYNIADNLLASDNLFYNPSAQHGYVEALRNYLNWVDLEAQPNANLDAEYFNALEDQTAAQIYETTQRVKAREKFEQEQKDGMTQGQEFYQWVANGGAPGYVNARQEVRAVESRIKDIQLRSKGPKAVMVSEDRDRLAKGLDTLVDNVGFNMHCAVGNILSYAEMKRRLQRGEKIPTPAFHRLPQYDAPTYKAFIQEAQCKSGGTYTPSDSIEFTVNTSDDISDFNFGQTNASANVGFSYGGWFSFNAGGSTSTTSTRLDTGSETSSIKFKILFDKMQKIDISPGRWNVDLSKYKLRPGAPDSVRTLVRPTQLVVVSRLGYEITLAGSSAKTVDDYVKSSTSAGGNLSIFGVPISVGGSGGRTNEHETHTGHWDSASKTFKVVPKDDTGIATVVGVVGEKFDILG